MVLLVTHTSSCLSRLHKPHACEQLILEDRNLHPLLIDLAVRLVNLLHLREITAELPSALDKVLTSMLVPDFAPGHGCPYVQEYKTYIDDLSVEVLLPAQDADIGEVAAADDSHVTRVL